MRFLLILLAFAVMGWGYWALSGGSDFEPRAQAATSQATPATPATPANAPAPLLDDVTAVAPTAAETAPPEPAPEPESARAPEPEPADPATDLALAPADTFTGPPPGDEPEPLSDQPILAADALALLAPEPKPEPEEATVAVASANVGTDLRRVTGNRVNVRIGPGTEHGVVAQVSAGDTAEVLGRDGGWVQIRTPDGRVGWMSARFLAESEG